MSLVHDRVGVQGHKVPVDTNTLLDIPEERYEDLEKLRSYADELNNARLELGRLHQVLAHLTNVCNTAEHNAAEAKKNIVDYMSLPEGNWAVDFDSKKVARVVGENPKTLRVVG